MNADEQNQYDTDVPDQKTGANKSSGVWPLILTLVVCEFALFAVFLLMVLGAAVTRSGGRDIVVNVLYYGGLALPFIAWSCRFNYIKTDKTIFILVVVCLVLISVSMFLS